jgi:hypothetical protein
MGEIANFALERVDLEVVVTPSIEYDYNSLSNISAVAANDIWAVGTAATHITLEKTIPIPRITLSLSTGMAVHGALSQARILVVRVLRIYFTE